jgi:hypothetical protein
VKLPVSPPVLPMLAKRVGGLPDGDSWIFEPKWDGFRTLIFRDGGEILIQSRDEKSLILPNLTQRPRIALLIIRAVGTLTRYRLSLWNSETSLNRAIPWNLKAIKGVGTVAPLARRLKPYV